MACTHLLLFLLLAPSSDLTSPKEKNAHFINQFSDGLKFAQEYLGMESVALKAAELVLKAFKPVHQDSRPDKLEPSNAWPPLRNLVRILGLNPGQVSAVALNAIVFLAQMISTFLSVGRNKPQISNEETLLDAPAKWILEKKSKNLQDLLSIARNQTLPDILINMIKENSQGEDTDCMRLLLCKVTPVIWKMQTLVFGDKLKDKPKDVSKILDWTSLLPTRDEMSHYGVNCELMHPDCNLE